MYQMWVGSLPHSDAFAACFDTACIRDAFAASSPLGAVCVCPALLHHHAAFALETTLVWLRHERGGEGKSGGAADGLARIRRE